MSKQAKEGAQITAENAVSEVMKARYYHGHDWQDYIADKFEEMGIQPKFKTINDGLGNRYADYQYEGTWVEAKTDISDTDISKIKDCYKILETMAIKMVIMAEWQPKSKKHSRSVKKLRDIGVIVYEGVSECESFIMNEHIRLNADKDIRMSIPMLIPFEDLVPHPDNRDLNVKNVPIIKVSIYENGFFTQINVVPHIIGPHGRRLYMVFEGHTRYYALKELVEKGYNVPPVACVCVPWITSENIEELHQMLILTNTTYKGWLLKNFVKSHHGIRQKLGDVNGIFSYGKILKAMNQAKKQGWGEASPVYMFSHKNSLKFDDMDKIKDGKYRISESEYESEILPILDLMTAVTSNGRKYNGSIIRDIIVDIRILYNTDDLIKSSFDKFLGFLKLKFISVYDNNLFPITKETGQSWWNTVKDDYYGYTKLGLLGEVESVQPKTIMSFVHS